MVSKHIIVKGEVQGVFFRATAKEVAEELSLKGWVRNTREGHVEALVSGTEENVEKFITWCRRGPDKAVVKVVIINESDENPPEGFSILR